MRRVPAIAVSLLLFAAFPAAAQLVGTDTAPGSSCAGFAQGVSRMTADPDHDGANVILICDGSVWQPMAAGSGGASNLDDLGDAFTDYSGGENVILGRPGATALNSGAYGNTFIGRDAGATAGNSTSNTVENTAVGWTSLGSLTSGKSNVALGYSTLAENSTGSNNVAIGAYTMRDNQSGANNIAIGGGALMEGIDAPANVAIGPSALGKNISGGGNIAIGYAAAFFNKSYANIAIGNNALDHNVGGNETVAIGTQAMENANDSATEFHTYNTAIGTYALQGSGTPSNNTGTSNTAVGHSALKENSSGTNNTAIGYDALKENTTGGGNTAFGVSSLHLNATGAENTAVGHYALFSNDTGGQNTAVGNAALMGNTGEKNAAFGFSAMHEHVSGDYNTAVGWDALFYHASGAENTALGAGALMGITTGDYNIAVGAGAGESLTSGSNNIVIGRDIDLPSATGSNQLNIGNIIYGTSIDGYDNTLSSGNIGIGTKTPVAKFDNAGSTALSGDISPAQITANQNDYNPTGLDGASVLRLTSDASRNITGLQGGADGRAITIFNIGSNNIVLKNQDGSSTAANRFAVGADITLGADQSATLIYDATSQRWRSASLPFSGTTTVGCDFNPILFADNTFYELTGMYGNDTYIFTLEYGEYLFAVNKSTFLEVGNYYTDTGTPGYQSIFANNTNIFVADGSPGVRAFTFDGTDFTLRATYNTAGSARGVWGDGTYIYVADNTNGVIAFTFSGTTWTPAAAGNITNSTYNTAGNANAVWSDGTYIYVADEDNGVVALTFNGTAWAPATGNITSSTYNTPGEVTSVWGDGTYIYIADGEEGLRALSFNGAVWTSLATYPVDDPGTSGYWHVLAVGGVIYVTQRDPGNPSWPYFGKAFTFNGSTFTFKDLIPAMSGDAMWSDGSRLYVAGAGRAALAASYALCAP